MPFQESFPPPNLCTPRIIAPATKDYAVCGKMGCSQPRFRTRPESPPPLKRDGKLRAQKRLRPTSTQEASRSAYDEGQHAPTVLERIRACLRDSPSILRATDTPPGRQRQRPDALRMEARGPGPDMRNELPRLDFRGRLHHRRYAARVRDLRQGS